MREHTLYDPSHEAAHYGGQPQKLGPIDLNQRMKLSPEASKMQSFDTISQVETLQKQGGEVGILSHQPYN